MHCLQARRDPVRANRKSAFSRGDDASVMMPLRQWRNHPFCARGAGGSPPGRSVYFTFYWEVAECPSTADTAKRCPQTGYSAEFAVRAQCQPQTKPLRLNAAQPRPPCHQRTLPLNSLPLITGAGGAQDTGWGPVAHVLYVLYAATLSPPAFSATRSPICSDVPTH